MLCRKSTIGRKKARNLSIFSKIGAEKFGITISEIAH
jgi:hypothetical protein